MKMIPAGTASANQYNLYVHNCTRNAQCEPPWIAPLPSYSALQLYVDFGETEPGTVEFTAVDYCTGAQSQIIPVDYVIGQHPENGYYGVFKTFSTPAGSFSAFVVHLDVDSGGSSYFSQMLIVEPCLPLQKIKSCHPEAATNTGFDVNDVYYGLTQGTFQGDDTVRYFHIAYVREGKLRELSNKGTFRSSLYANFRTTIERVYQHQSEIVPKWYKDVLLAIFSRGAVSFDDGQVYIVSDLAFEGLNDDDLIWKAWAQLKVTHRLYYGCDDGLCEECCTPTLVDATAFEGAPDCCNPILLTATSTTIDSSESDGGSGSDGSGSGSGGGSGSGSEPEDCCTVTVTSVTTEIVEDPPEESEGSGGSGSDASGSEDCCTVTVVDVTTEIIPDPCCDPEVIDAERETVTSESVPDTDGIMVLLSADAYATMSLEDLTFWNTFYNTGVNAATPFDEILLYPDDLKIVLKGATELILQNPWESNPELHGFWDNSGSVIEASGSFVDCAELAEVELAFTETIGDGVFASCPALVSVLLTAATSVGAVAFQFCSGLTEIDLPNVVSVGNNAMQGCTSLTDISLPACSDLGGTTGDNNVFQGITGNTMTLTILTATATDGDVVTLQANNTVTLILV